MSWMKYAAALTTAWTMNFAGWAVPAPSTGPTSWRTAAEANAQRARVSARDHLDSLPGGRSFELEAESVTPDGYSFQFRDTKYNGPGNWCEVYTDGSGKVTGVVGGL